MSMCQLALHICDCEYSLSKLETWNLIVQNSNKSHYYEIICNATFLNMIL